MNDLQKAAQDVIDRWDTPLWKDVPSTAEFIYKLRNALSESHQPKKVAENRAVAMLLYKPPFKFVKGYVYDAQNLMVADDEDTEMSPKTKGAFLARVRGWGRLSYLPNAAELQDEIGKMLADAMTEYYNKNS